MKINYDKDVDALSVTLRKGEVARTVEISPEIMVDFDSAGNPLYIEILDASIKVGKKAMQHITIGKLQIPFASAVASVQ
jgi:uncharacterized protein YuzE